MKYTLGRKKSLGCIGWIHFFPYWGEILCCLQWLQTFFWTALASGQISTQPEGFGRTHKRKYIYLFIHIIYFTEQTAIKREGKGGGRGGISAGVLPTVERWPLRPWVRTSIRAVLGSIWSKFVHDTSVRCSPTLPPALPLSLSPSLFLPHPQPTPNPSAPPRQDRQVRSTRWST